MARAFPFLATLVIGVAQAIAWRASAPMTTWMVLAGAWAAMLIASLFLLRREELLAESFRVVPGDISRGIGGAAVAVMLIALAGFAGVRLMPTRIFDELRTLIYVATAVKVEWHRAVAIVGLAACEEIAFRGAVAAFLEERFGSARAPYAASALYVLSTVPSLRPSVILASIIVGGITAFLIARFQRLIIAIVAHAAFSWLAIEFVVPTLWQNLMRPH